MQINLASISLADSQRGSRKEIENTHDKLFKGALLNWQGWRNGILQWFRYILHFIKCSGKKKWPNNSILDRDGMTRCLFDMYSILENDFNSLPVW